MSRQAEVIAAVRQARDNLAVVVRGMYPELLPDEQAEMVSRAMDSLNRRDVGGWGMAKNDLAWALQKYMEGVEAVESLLRPYNLDGRRIHVANVLQTFSLADGKFSLRGGRTDYPWEFNVLLNGCEIYTLYNQGELNALVTAGRFTRDEIRAALPPVTLFDF